MGTHKIDPHEAFPSADWPAGRYGYSRGWGAHRAMGSMPAVPDAQRDAIASSNYRYEQDRLARNPVPGTHIWRTELRPDSESPTDVRSTGMHWTVDPNMLAGVQPAYPSEGRRNVIWHGILDDPTTAMSRNHPSMQGRTAPATSDYEVRFEPGRNVNVHGAWVQQHDDPGPFTPLNPDRMGSGWQYHQVSRQLPVQNRGHIDYGTGPNE